jgi:purine-nucleoside phosphorylase
MSTPHNSANKGDFAKTVLMPGDPLRAKFVAENFLTEARLVNNVRGIGGYTGTYKGIPVSVMASGMGMPSMGIYSYELYRFYGVENIIRIGSAGALQAHIKLRELGFGMGACTTSNYAAQYGLHGTFAPTIKSATSCFWITKKIPTTPTCSRSCAAQCSTSRCRM